MNEPKNEALINRIKKLLALGSEANPSAAEREVALTKAHELLAEHNLSISDLSEKDDIGVRSSGLSDLPWCRQLTHAVAKLYYCESLTHTDSEGGELCFLGTAENTLVATMMTDYLANSIAREATIRYLASEEHKDSFCIGAATTVRSRIDYMLIKERTPKESVIWTPTSQEKQNQLVHLRNKLEQRNQKYMEDEQIKMNEAPEVKVNSWAFSDGANYGYSLGLEKQIGGGKEVKRIEGE